MKKIKNIILSLSKKKKTSSINWVIETDQNHGVVCYIELN